MFERLDRESSIILQEVCSAVPGLIRDAVELSEALEASPCSHSDAERSIDSLFHGLAEVHPLLSNKHFATNNPHQNVAAVKAALALIERQFKGLADGRAEHSPGELVRELSKAERDAPPISDSTLRMAIREACDSINQLITQSAELGRQIYKSQDEVLEDESIRLIEMDPEDASHHRQLGEALASQGKLEQALVSFRHAHERDPDDPACCYFLGKCLHDLGSSAEAKRHVLRSIELFPSNGVTWNLLGKICERLGEGQGAVDAHLKAVKKSYGETKVDSEVALQRLSTDRALQLPRPDNFQLPDIDERFYYSGFHGCESNCRIRLFRQEGGAIVLATRDKLSTGTSITNMAESLARAVGEKYKIPWDGLTWIEHYEKYSYGEQTLKVVGFKLRADGIPEDPVWRELSFEEFEGMTGYRLSWSNRA